MNKIIIISLMLLLLVGCGGKAVEQCNYQPFLDQNTNLIEQNTACQTEKNTCELNLLEQKNTNNQLKLQMLNNLTQTPCVQTSCNTVVRLLNEKEDQLEECWLHSNASTYVTNYSYYNATMADALENCTEMLAEINETLYG